MASKACLHCRHDLLDMESPGARGGRLTALKVSKLLYKMRLRTETWVQLFLDP